ncbi:conserved Plasmodium protein, unknown function [Plasmodium ovale]|uniref:Uncharacterized protein n=2 Tax=Plasmodium ovale TaxID=36330 RepID=A0A1A8WM49_PLAOA|nr:hypothetical protein POVCU2_0027510 [Plasmodium ovale curtisi]SBS93282.1 hypothetical protein POVCU1_025120 [Plasmodium ovale curtisi]SCQ16619.1 conserved Plasmodium protein, unknown function [Plasmodium ovale]
MDEKKKVFYNYVDNMHRKNEEIHKTLDKQKKRKKEEQKKIEDSERIIKNNDVYIDTVDNIHKNNELNYINLKKEISIQRRKLQSLNTLLCELPELMQEEDKKYDALKKESRREINELMDTLEPRVHSKSPGDMWNKIRDCQKSTELLNNTIKDTNCELALLNKEHCNSRDKLRDLVELEKNKNKKLKKISVTLQFIQNLKQGVHEKTNNEGDLKRKLEEINDLYK